MSPQTATEHSLLRTLGQRTLLAFVATLAASVAVGPLQTEPAFATVVKVGNGDDGGDLEGGQKVTSGILVQTRDKALAKIRNLQVQSIEHLGALIPELEKSDLYLVPRDLAAKIDDDQGMESSADGKSVYARTFAEPHASTRFFPSALMLNEDQLVALHIHEALHRSLPASVREDEKVVTKITLAIAGPDASADRIRTVVQAELPRESGIIPASATSQVFGGSGQPVTVIVNNGGVVSMESKFEKPEAPLERPSSVTYGFRSFFIPEKKKSAYPVESMHTLQSFLYPFGTGSRAFGLGLEFSYLKTPEQAFLGPLSLSARMRLLSVRGFDVGLWGTYAMNTAAADEIKNSPLGRDIATIGLSAKRDTANYYVENLIALSGEGEAEQKIGRINYTHSYGALTSASVRAGGKVGWLELGGFAEVLLANFYRVNGGAFSFDSGRYRIISAGPELAVTKDMFRMAFAARWVIDSTPGVSLDYLGDILGRGMGQGYVSTSASMRF